MVSVTRLLLVSFFVVTLPADVCFGNKANASAAIFPSYKKYAHEEEEEETGELKTFAQVENKMRSIIDEVIRKVLPYVIRASADIRLSGKCMASIFKLVIGMQKLQEWAIRMIDATGKPPSGVIQGTSMSLGDFDECLNIKVEKTGTSPHTRKEEYFHGKYCMVECRAPKGLLDAAEEYNDAPISNRSNTAIGKTKTILNMLGKFSPFVKIASFRFGVCIPSTCNEDDLGSIVNTATKQLGFPLRVLHCQEPAKLHFRIEHKIILTFLCASILVVLAGTVGDIYFSRIPLEPTTKRNRWRTLSVNLSIICNTKKLFDVKEKRSHPFPVARGMLFLTVVLNILAHTYVMYNHLFFYKYSNLINYLEFMKQFSFSFVANGSNGIENYFFIAGFLLTYTRWRRSIITAELNMVNLFVKPYIRLTLVQLFGICIFLLLPLVGYGPFFGDFVGPYLENCRTKWWSNLFYIQNYWNSEETCLYHTWVFAVIMQSYVVAIAVIWLLIKNPNFGIALTLAVIVIAMGIVGATVFIKQLPGALSPYVVVNVDAGIRLFNSLFIQTFDHIGSFSIGLLTGFLLPKYQHTIKFKPVMVCICWCVATASLLAVIFGLYEYRFGGEQMNPNLSILYAMLNRNVYALFLAWFFVACATGNAGFFPKIFSWKAMIPGYRLSLLAYILHLIVMYYHVGILRERVYLSHEENIINYFGYLMSTYLLAFVCYLFFQAPYMHLERLIYRRVSRYFGKDTENENSPELTDTTVMEKDNVEKLTKVHLPVSLDFFESTISNGTSTEKNHQTFKA